MKYVFLIIALLITAVTGCSGDSSDESSAGSSPTGRAADYVIAASDASSMAKAQADAVCSGADDDAIIRDAFFEFGKGAVVELTSGTFYINSPIYPTANNQVLRGQGWGFEDDPAGTTMGATLLYLDDNANCAVIQGHPTDTIHNFVLENFSIDGNASNNAEGTYGVDETNLRIKLEKIYIRHTRSHGIYGGKSGESKLWTEHDRVRIHNCGGDGVNYSSPETSFWTDVLSVENDGKGFYFNECASIKMNFCEAGNNGSYGLHMDDCTSIQVTDFRCESNDYGSWFEDCQGGQVVSFNSHASGTDGDKRAVSITGTKFNVKGGRLTFNGIYINNSSISGHTGLYLNGVSRGQIIGVMINETAGEDPVGVSYQDLGDEYVQAHVFIPHGTRFVDNGSNTRAYIVDTMDMSEEAIS